MIKIPLNIFHHLKSRPSKPQNQSEIEYITTCLIEETKKELAVSFYKAIENEKSKGEAIELEFVKQTMKILINKAIANRKMLIGRLEKDVEAGDLFDRYYGKMQTINTLTNSAYALMQRMDIAEERYTYENSIYKKITGKMYIPDAIPDDIKPGKGKRVRRDILEVMDERKQSIEEGVEN